MSSLARWLILAVLGTQACAAPRAAVTSPPPVAAPPTSNSFTCAAPKDATPSNVDLNVVGTLDTAETKALAAELCPRLIEAGYCISIVHADQPELRGTLDVELDLIP